MRKIAVSAFLLVVILASTGAPATAITGDYVEDFEHPFVGMIAFLYDNGTLARRCSGSLITPTAFLTAKHCTDTASGTHSAVVYFQQHPDADYDPALGYDPVTGYPTYCAKGTLGTVCATSHTLIDYSSSDSVSRDFGLVILDQPIAVSEYAQLPAANFLDTLDTQRGQHDVTFTVSGYGWSYTNQPQTGKPNISYRERLMATEKLVNLINSGGFLLEIEGNGTGMGHTCFGDSGGPTFYGEYTSNLIVAVTAGGFNYLCRGADLQYRIDQQVVLDWIHAHVTDFPE